MNLLANEIEHILPKNIFFCDLRELARKLARAFGQPTQVSSQVQLVSICDYLPVRLARVLEKKNELSYLYDIYNIMYSEGNITVEINSHLQYP